MHDPYDSLAFALALPVALLFILNGLDDLFVDLSYFVRGPWRDRRLTIEQLKSRPQQRIAIFVPAWREADVIEHMLENTLKTLDYDPTRFDVFVGTYPNDLECQARVDAVSARVPNVRKVVVPHDGPTSKADCLNWVFQGIKLHEQTWGVEYDILLLHDSEDVVHPLELRLHNFFIPDYDFVQTPVLPLEVPWYSLVGGSYLDDFAENHLKDMPVRAALGGLVPSAGVGSGFARAAFEEIALANQSQPFDPTSLTEDYEIGLKFRLAGKRTLFACKTVLRPVEGARDARGRARRAVREEFIATREYFPRGVSAAIKQRSRWILGIDFQTWEKVGWAGPAPVLYCLWRDRKAMLAHVLSMLGYVLVLYVVARYALSALQVSAWSPEGLFPTGSPLWWLLVCTTALLVWRSIVRFAIVQRVYGTAQGLASLVRLPIGNVTSFLALAKAARQFAHHKRTGTPLKWASTAHTFPSTEALATYRKRLGELLVEREGLTQVSLDGALELQKRIAEPLGTILTHGGYISEEQLTRALATQWSIPVVDPEATEPPEELLKRLTESEAERLEALPVALRNGVATVAVARPLDVDQKLEIEQRLGVRVQIACAPSDALREARERVFLQLNHQGAPAPPPRLGEQLVALGLLRPEDLALALQERRRTGEHLAELLLRRRLVTPKDLSRIEDPALSAGFRLVGPREGDPEVLRALGLGPCALYTMVPLRVPEEGAHALASAFPLHPRVLAAMTARLGSPLRPALAPLADVRLALHVAERTAWPSGHIAGLGGVDGAELAIAAEVLQLAVPEIQAIISDAVSTQLAPLDLLVRAGRCSRMQLVQILTRTYGLSAPPAVSLAREPHVRRTLREVSPSVTLASDSPSGVHLATARPRPEVARKLAARNPTLPIAWQLVSSGHDGVAPPRAPRAPGVADSYPAAVS